MDWDYVHLIEEDVSMKVFCEYCEQPLYKAESKVKRSRHNFCSRECCIAYRKEHGYINKKKKDFTSLSKIKLLAELRKSTSLKTGHVYSNCDKNADRT